MHAPNTLNTLGPAALVEGLRAALADRTPVAEASDGATPAGVLVPLQYHDGGWHVIVNVRSNEVSQHKGEIAFPGGKLEQGETPVAALKRELEEEVGVRPERPELLLVQDYSYPEREVQIHFFLCRLCTRPKLEQGRWVQPSGLSQYRLPPANDAVVVRILRLRDSRV